MRKPLTKKGIEVLKLKADGLPNKQIADKLCISELTVKYHNIHNLHCLGAVSTPHAVAIAKDRGII